MSEDVWHIGHDAVAALTRAALDRAGITPAKARMMTVRELRLVQGVDLAGADRLWQHGLCVDQTVVQHVEVDGMRRELAGTHVELETLRQLYDALTEEHGKLRRALDSERASSAELRLASMRTTEWGEPYEEWTTGVYCPDGRRIIEPLQPDPMMRTEAYQRAVYDRTVANAGYRKALLRHTVSAWREVESSP